MVSGWFPSDISGLGGAESSHKQAGRGGSAVAATPGDFGQVCAASSSSSPSSSHHHHHHHHHPNPPELLPAAKQWPTFNPCVPEYAGKTSAAPKQWHHLSRATGSELQANQKALRGEKKIKKKPPRIFFFSDEVKNGNSLAESLE